MRRTVVETLSDRRIVREYDDAGALVRVLVEPVRSGVTPDLPPVVHAPAPRRPLFSKPKRAAAPPPPVAAPVAPPVAPPPPVDAAPAPEPEPEPVRVAPPEPPAPPPRFEVLAAEPILEPPPEPAAAEEDEPTVEEPPVPLAVEPEAPHVEEEPAPEPPPPVVEPAPAVEPARELEPAPPQRFDVPDLEARVDALFTARDRPVKARKRAPLAVPEFAPLEREAWESRLDDALKGR